MIIASHIGRIGVRALYRFWNGSGWAYLVMITNRTYQSGVWVSEGAAERWRAHLTSL